MTSAQRVNNLCTMSVHLKPIRIWVAPHKSYSLPKNTESWMVQLERKSLNNLSLLKDLACCSKLTTHWQNPAQTEACQLAVWRHLTSLWVDRPSSGGSCALHKESGSIKSLVWWNSWGWSKHCGSYPNFLGLSGNMISMSWESVCSHSAPRVLFDDNWACLRFFKTFPISPERLGDWFQYLHLCGVFVAL